MISESQINFRNAARTAIAPTSPVVLKPDIGETYFTTAEAAIYVRFRTASGVRQAVACGELVPVGAGPRGSHLFTRAQLDEFVARRRILRIGTAGAPSEESCRR
jgi:hypothetical protein